MRPFPAGLVSAGPFPAGPFPAGLVSAGPFPAGPPGQWPKVK